MLNRGAVGGGMRQRRVSNRPRTGDRWHWCFLLPPRDSQSGAFFRQKRSFAPILDPEEIEQIPHHDDGNR